MAVESVAVPFLKWGNRRCLTDEQLADEPWLADFIARFPASFERDYNRFIWLFVEPEMDADVD